MASAASSAAPEQVHAQPAESTLLRQAIVFALILACEFFYGWAWNTVDVLRPYIRQSLGLSLLQAGSAYSAQGAGALLGAVTLGQLADRFGRRKVLAGIVAGYGLMLLAGIVVASYPQLLLQRFLLGIFAGGSFPVVVGIYINLFQPSLRGRLAGTLNAAFSLSIVMLGVAMGAVAPQDWKQLLLMGGIPPLLLVVLILATIPTGSRIDRGALGKVSRLPVKELFAPGLRRQTIMLATMTGLNFFGYAAFSGWLTTYLTGERHLSPALAGELVAWQFSGNIVGGFFWGWAADRFGRRFNAVGFLIASAAILTYLLAPANPTLLKIVGCIYGGALCSSVIWGPWMAELYPAHLQSTAASIFNWGRVISFFAPLLTAQIAQSFNLATAMSLGAVSFTTAAIIWFMQRETLPRRTVP